MYQRDYFGLSGLGFTTTAQSPAQSIVGGALDAVPVIGPMLDTIASFIHIGAGRNEADQITPTQNILGDYLARVSAFIDQTTSVPALQKVGTDLATQWAHFQAFINNRTQFPDGRASAGAYSTLNPIVTSIQQRIVTKISQLGGSGWNPLQILQGASGPSLEVPTYGEPSIPQAGMLTYYPQVNQASMGIGSSMLIPFALAAGAAYLFTRRKG
jgi:hypothetical protein